MAFYTGGYRTAAAAAGVGSQEDVKKLQTELNTKGASVTVDGIYGPETDAAYRTFGIAAGGETEKSRLPGVSGETAEKLSQYEEGYTPPETVKQAQAAYEAAAEAKPEAFVSRYEGELEALYDSIADREPFRYDMDGDALYRQYRDAYVRQGQAAMEDTMGQAAALTGGYGSTYAESAGAQAYDRYLMGLGDILPELYGAALDRYAAEGDALQQRYDALADLRQEEYAAYRDAYDAWQDAVSMSYSTWQDALEQDRETWAEGLDYWTERAEAENEAYLDAYQNAGSGGGSGGTVSGKKTETKKEQTDKSGWGRYARALDREFTENAYGKYDLYGARKDYLAYYRDKGLITVREYEALLAGDYGA